MLTVSTAASAVLRQLAHSQPLPLADDASADDGQQRKRRGRIGNMASEPSASTKDSQRAAALETAEDMLMDSPDADRSSGELLMECVVKVTYCCSFF